jgi:hypothetical protein
LDSLGDGFRISEVILLSLRIYLMGERNLLVDVYSGDLGGKPNWQAVVDAPNFVGGIPEEDSCFVASCFFVPSWLLRPM